MEFYEAVEKRRTVRDFTEKRVPDEILNRILEAGLKAPSHDHARDWHFVVLRRPERIAEILRHVAGGAEVQTDIINHWNTATECQKSMYYDALPKQVKMLSQSRCLVLPLFRAGADLMTPREVILNRLEKVAAADLVTVLYNPASTRRRELPERAVEIFRSHGGNLPAALVRDAYRDGQSVKLVTLDEFPFAEVQMTTVVIVGNSETIARDGKLYVRRGYKEKYGLEK